MKALILWWDEAQWPLAREALHAAGRRDLIGRAVGCLVPPDHGAAPGLARPPGRRARG
jgi:hypothetical protein